MKKIRIGSRDSALAVAQTQLVIDRIKVLCPELVVELVTMKTTGDKILHKGLHEIGGKGLFVKELDEALLNGQVDYTVHSLKDLPMEVNPDLPVMAYFEREDPRDVLVLPQSYQDGDRPFDRVGSSSLRRKLQLKKLFPEAEFSLARGNIVTRLRKLDKGEYSALILAAAGLKRLGLEQRINRYFSVEEILPPAGQGILAIQGRKGEEDAFLSKIDCPDSRDAATAERSFVGALNGGCSSPVAALAQLYGQEIKLSGLYYNEASEAFSVSSLIGERGKAYQIGQCLAEKMKKEWNGIK